MDLHYQLPAHLANVVKYLVGILLGVAISWTLLANQCGPNVSFGTSSGIEESPSLWLRNDRSLALRGPSRRVLHELGHGEPGYLAMCLLARDGNDQLREWVEYHLFAGVDKIFLFDHNSTVPMLNEVADYVAEGKVQYTYFTSTSPRVRTFADGLQGRVYRTCFEQARQYYKWMAFTDLDEYIIVTDTKYNFSIPALLKKYEDFGAVLAHWQRLGSMGIEKRAPGQGFLNTFTKCAEPCSHVKGIANLKFASLGGNAHHFYYSHNRHGVRPGDSRLVGSAHAIEHPLGKPIVIYHYNGANADWQGRVARMRSGVSGFTQKSSHQYEDVTAKSTLDCVMGQRAWELMEKRPKPAYGQLPSS